MNEELTLLSQSQKKISNKYNYKIDKHIEQSLKYHYEKVKKLLI